jgi:hypothetical protein
MKGMRRVKLTTIRRRRLRLEPPAIRAHCPACGREVETLTAAQAAEVLEIDAPLPSHFIAAGRVHVMRTVSGSLRVCQDSLFA